MNVRGSAVHHGPLWCWCFDEAIKKSPQEINVDVEDMNVQTAGLFFHLLSCKVQASFQFISVIDAFLSTIQSNR